MRPRRRCSRCGQSWPIARRARDDEGDICDSCYKGAPPPARCAGGPGPATSSPLATCRSCGAEERPYLDACCVRCVLATRASQLIHVIAGPLRPVYEAVVAAPQAYSAHNWLRRPAAAGLLAEVASGKLALTHEALDAHPARRCADYPRHLLVPNGALPWRDDALALRDLGRQRLASTERYAQLPSRPGWPLRDVRANV